MMMIKPSRMERANRNRNRFFIPNQDSDVFESRHNSDGRDQLIQVVRGYVAEKPVAIGQPVMIIGLEHPIDAIVVDCKNPSSIVVVDKQEFFHQVSFAGQLEGQRVCVQLNGPLGSKLKAGFCANKQQNMPMSRVQQTFVEAA